MSPANGERDRPPGGPVTGEHYNFLALHSRTFLIVRGQDGAPIGYPMTGRLFDGALEFNTYRKSVKVTHLARDNRVCCVVIPRDRAADPRVLSVWGRAEPSEASREHWLEATPSAGIDVPADIVSQVQDRLLSGKRVIYRVLPLTAAFTSGVHDAG
jgi:hypothetical protein